MSQIELAGSQVCRGSGEGDVWKKVMKGRKLWRRRAEGTSLELLARVRLVGYAVTTGNTTDSRIYAQPRSLLGEVRRPNPSWAGDNNNYFLVSELFIGLGPRGVAISCCWAMQLLPCLQTRPNQD